MSEPQDEEMEALYQDQLSDEREARILDDIDEAYYRSLADDGGYT